MLRWGVAAALALCLVAGRAQALPRVNGRHGLGISLGAPDGLTLEEIFSEKWAFDLAGGRNLFQSGRYYGHADLIYTLKELHLQVLTAPIYLGLGGQVVGGADNLRDDVRGGVRVPLGIQVGNPLQSCQAYLEAAIRLDVQPDFAAHFDATFGFRYFL